MWTRLQAAEVLPEGAATLQPPGVAAVPPGESLQAAASRQQVDPRQPVVARYLAVPREPAVPRLLAAPRELARAATAVLAVAARSHQAAERPGVVG
jgi:hypothetical protein